MSQVEDSSLAHTAEALRGEIIQLVRRYHALAFPPEEFAPGESPVRVGGRVFDAEELVQLTEAALDFWLTAGPCAQRFERDFASFVSLRHASLVNSGSSANLVAISALTSPRLGDRRLRPGDEVITAAAGFPTTINPIVQNGLIPVFVDVDLPTYNVDISQLEAAVSERTRAIVLAHALGNPFDLGAVTDFARAHDLWLVEDCCDAVGSLYDGRHVGTFGDLATVSFYPAHHLTMGEGGCVLTDDDRLKVLADSFRDWGRDCWCRPGEDDACGKRFEWRLGDLPGGYDHKYIFSDLGYNLKVTDLQAAVGLAQLAKLPDFIEARRRNFQVLYDGVRDLDDFLILPQPTAGSEPSWFGFPLAVRTQSPVSRMQLVRHLEAHRIASRMLFAGNITRQPAYRGVPMRIVGDLVNSDFIMDHVFWLGVFPGLSREALDFTLEVIHDAFRR